MKNNNYIYQWFGGVIIYQELTTLFHGELRNEIINHINDNKLQEIRIKINEPCILYFDNEEIITNHKVSREEMKMILQKILNYSIYAYEEEIRQGFVTIQGGHRVGLAGECVMNGEDIKTIKYISSVNIRVCREIIGCSNKIIKYIVNNERIFNTLIVSPPKCGKTTIIRDIARNLSMNKKKVSIIDERSEIAACFMGVPRMNLGARCDVLDNCLKSRGMIMAIRSLSPDVIVCDEIGRDEDYKALELAFNSGINVICTIHGFDIADIKRRKIFNELILDNILERIIVLSSKRGVCTIDSISKVEDRRVVSIG